MTSQPDVNNDSNCNQKDEFTNILGPNFNLESMVHETGLPNMDSKDVEEIFKGVLTDESQDSHDSVMPETPTNGSVSSSSFSINHSNVNSAQSVVSNQQQGVIMSQGPPAMSPSHSGNFRIILAFSSSFD